MKNSYKTSLFTIATIAVALVAMSSFVNEKTTSNALVNFEPTAYQNLVTYQEGDMFVYATASLKAEKVEKFQQAAEKSLAANGLVPKSLTEAVKFSEKDPTAFYAQDSKTGTLSFNKGMEGYYNNKKLQLPDEAKAKELSLSFIKNVGLAPEDMKELKMMHSGGLRASDAGSENVTDLLRTITYGRMLNGVPVYGAGSKIVVNVGNNGEIVGVKSRWKQVEKTASKQVKTASLISAKEAEVQMQRKLISDYGKDAKFKIKDMYLAYYDGGENFIQPAYFFQVDINLPEVKGSPSIKFDYIGIVAALPNPPESIAAAQDSPEAQKMIKNLGEKGARITKEKDPKDND